MNVKNLKYKVTGVVPEDPKQSLIEKKGHVITFTIQQVEDHEAQLAQVFKEIEAKLTVEKAKMTNIETNHAFVKDLSEQDLFTAHMYMESKSVVKVCESKLDEIKKQMEDYASEKSEIYKQLPQFEEKIKSTPDEKTK